MIGIKNDAKSIVGIALYFKKVSAGVALVAPWSLARYANFI